MASDADSDSVESQDRLGGWVNAPIKFKNFAGKLLKVDGVFSSGRFNASTQEDVDQVMRLEELGYYGQQILAR